MWEPYNGNENNLGTINLGSNSGRSLTERITNSIDALLEARANVTTGTKPNSPQEAMANWFGRPISGPDSGLFEWDYSAAKNDRKLHVILQPGDTGESPTVDVLDAGVGVSPTEFPNTILSLHRGNKITKKYVAGAYGQGGASTLRFCDFVLIASRSPSNPGEIGFTLVRKVRLDESYKEDCYAYLAVRSLEGKASVLVATRATPILVRVSEVLKREYSITTGTLVRHYGFQLSGNAAKLSAVPGNLYHFLHYSMFDPLFPFRIVDNREASTARDEIVRGSRNRLMSYAKVREEADEDSRTQLMHYRPMEWVVPAGSTKPCVGVEYWVIYNYERKRKNADYQLRPDSNALYIRKKHPVVFTLNGQNQGDLGNYLFKQANLPMVSRHTIVHIDASAVPKDVRNGLFTSTREGVLEEGAVAKSIMQELFRMISEDEVLHELEKKLEDSVTQKASQETEGEVQRQISALLKEAGFESTESANTDTPGKNGGGAAPTPQPPKPPVEPLPTLPFPEVTELEIVYPKPSFELAINSTKYLSIHTNADARMNDRLDIRFEPVSLGIASRKPLKGGRAGWRLRATDDAKVGQKGRVVVTITKLDGAQLSDSTEFILAEPKSQPAKDGKGKIPPFKILPITPDDSFWPSVWDEDVFTDKLGVAYKPMKTADMIVVYYSTVFGPYAQTVERLKTQNENKMKLFITNYQVWIGYHAIIQLKSQLIDADTREDESIELEQDAERVRVAQLQIRQAMTITDLMLKVSKAQEAER
ncbi:MAG TPA: hypothetical protein PLS92_01890 [Flavobacteriales bacterium]|nr:hypothetical protein [Flavobacteriales bacterium]QQS73664.1 MAG: hypothetical protein IPP95_05435 [Flavobacteriales bacterium]HQV37409.1 hypothetical protein [Flavobacteriales bacterium]HQW31146.1 hypothetical protein [Flavobacteriales bacterium]HQY02138.1 hypothetical protein [Flavobacteriales bacterium]